jgi:hypothetical protein
VGDGERPVNSGSFDSEGVLESAHLGDGWAGLDGVAQVRQRFPGDSDAGPRDGAGFDVLNDWFAGVVPPDDLFGVALV